MKTSFFKICIISLFSFSFLAGTCTSDDDSNDETSFTPITLIMANTNIDVNDTSFSIDGYNFSAYRAKTYSIEAPNVSDEDNGIILAYPQDSNASSIELNLSNTSGISTITLEIFNNCSNGCTVIKTLNNNNTLQELNDNTSLPPGRSFITIENISSSITALKISSFETIIYTITLE